MNTKPFSAHHTSPSHPPDTQWPSGHFGVADGSMGGGRSKEEGGAPEGHRAAAARASVLSPPAKSERDVVQEELKRLSGSSSRVPETTPQPRNRVSFSNFLLGLAISMLFQYVFFFLALRPSQPSNEGPAGGVESEIGGGDAWAALEKAGAKAAAAAAQAGEALQAGVGFAGSFESLGGEPKKTEKTGPPIPSSQLAPPLRVVFPNITDWRPKGSPLLRNSLEAVVAAFSAHGYQEVGAQEGQWDVMWSYHYPFKTFYRQLKDLKPHQRVNHFPGPGAFFTNKTVLATHSGDLSCTPRAFQLPTQYPAFAEFAGSHPEHMWVVKSAGHRGVRVVKPEEVPRDAFRMFVQRYVRDALLIDGHRFDVGAYVAITSMNPLRVYVYDDVLLRFCMSEYDASAFDPRDLDTYVIADTYIPPWDMPSLHDGFARGLSSKGAILDYWESRGVDGARLFANLHDAVAEVLVRFEPSVYRAGAPFPRAHISDSPYFELFRFDFVVDAALRPWLMEVNMSPNLSAAKTSGLRNMFSRIAYDLLSLAGLGGVDRTRPRDSLRTGQPFARYHAWGGEDLWEPGGRLCYAEGREGCDCGDTLSPCHVCSYCGGGEEKSSLLARAAEEHMARRGFLRVTIPPESFFDPTTQRRNRLMHTWYRLRCARDPSWC